MVKMGGLVYCLLLPLLWHDTDVMAVECYTCSWSPADQLLENDRCSSEHFDPERVRAESCNVGCEVVKMWDSNGELTMFFRNCLMASHNKIPFEYNKRSSIMMEEEVFACDSDYCNASPPQLHRLHPFHLLSLFTLPAVLSRLL